MTTNPDNLRLFDPGDAIKCSTYRKRIGDKDWYMVELTVNGVPVPEGPRFFDNEADAKALSNRLKEAICGSATSS